MYSPFGAAFRAAGLDIVGADVRTVILAIGFVILQMEKLLDQVWRGEVVMVHR
jgi:hypothetical protein